MNHPAKGPSAHPGHLEVTEIVLGNEAFYGLKSQDEFWDSQVDSSRGPRDSAVGASELRNRNTVSDSNEPAGQQKALAQASVQDVTLSHAESGQQMVSFLRYLVQQWFYATNMMI